MTKKPKPLGTSKSPMPSYLKEAFNMVQPGKSNHQSAKNSRGKGSKGR